MPSLAMCGGKPIRSTPIPKRWPAAGQREIDRLAELIAADAWYKIVGDATEQLESELAAYHDLRYAVAVSSGLDAINIGLRALGLGPGDEVIIPGYTCIADGIAALQANTIPVYADVEPESWCLDPQAMTDAIGPRTKAVVPVHFAGNVADMPAIEQIAREHDLAILEDAALAQGATRFGRPIGSWGDLTILSFGEDKPMTAGRGGMILTNEEPLARTCRALRDRGRMEKDFYGAWQATLGGNFFPGELLCTVLLGQFERYPEQIALQEANAWRLRSLLQNLGEIRLVTRLHPGERNVVNMLMLEIDRDSLGVDNARFAEALQAEGVRCSRGYTEPLDRHPVMQSPSIQRCPLGCPQGSPRKRPRPALPVSEAACRSGIWLWQDFLVNEPAVMDDVARAIRKVITHIDELRVP